MNTSFERSANASDEWYTPREIIEALGEFDLDPCAPMHPLWPTAKIMYNKQDNGLIQNWGGRIWLNPPYSKPLIWQFVEKLAEHGNGIALLFNRCDSNKFQDIIFTKATRYDVFEESNKILPSRWNTWGQPRLWKCSYCIWPGKCRNFKELLFTRQIC